MKKISRTNNLTINLLDSYLILCYNKYIKREEKIKYVEDELFGFEEKESDPDY
jgi:hypothetical protein